MRTKVNADDRSHRAGTGRIDDARSFADEKKTPYLIAFAG